MKAPPTGDRSRRRIGPRTAEPCGITSLPLRSTSLDTFPSINVPTDSLSEIDVVSSTVINNKAGTFWPVPSAAEGIEGDPGDNAGGGSSGFGSKRRSLWAEYAWQWVKSRRL